MHYIQSVLKLKHRMSKFAGLRNPSAGFRKLLAVLMLIVLSENRCGFFISLFLFLSDEAGFDHKAHNIVFLKHPALQEATSDQASSSVTALCCRKHMKYKHKRMFFFLQANEARFPERRGWHVCPTAKMKCNTKAKPTPLKLNYWPWFSRLIIFS